MESVLLNRLATLSHPQRMAVFQLLVRRCPDALPAGEIARSLGLKASTASVYLSHLTRSGLIKQQRRGTSLLYHLNIEAARGMMAEFLVDCCRGRPDLCPTVLRRPDARLEPDADGRFSVLFLCRGNSARSILAEAVLRHYAPETFNVYSAGTAPYAQPHPLAIEALAEEGIDVKGLNSKDVTGFQKPDAPHMHFVITTCDLAANEDCPPWHGHPLMAHWGLRDPVLAVGDENSSFGTFHQTLVNVRDRVRALAALPIAGLDRRALQSHLDTISRLPEFP